MKSEISMPVRKPGRPAVDRREEILDAAHRLYETLGFEKTTMSDIARELDMSPANLYRSFPNRQAIDEAIVRRTLGHLEDAAWSAAREATHDAPAAFRKMVLGVSAHTRELLVSAERLPRLCAVASRERWPVVEAFVQNLRSAVRHILSEGQRQGVFTPSLPDDTADTISEAMMMVWHPHMIDIYRDEDLAAAGNRLAELVLRGLKK